MAQRYSFRLYGQEGGLKNLTVGTLVQDRAGFLWVGTENGLFRYDGERFLRFSQGAGLTAQRATSLHESADGALWVGTEAGLYRRASDRFERVELGVSAEAAAVLAIASDRRGRLYVGTENGLAVGEPGRPGAPLKFHWQTGRDGRSRETVGGIHVDGDDVVWYGCGWGLCSLEEGRIRIFTSHDGVPEGPWGGIVTDREGSLWIRSAERLLVRGKRAGHFAAADQEVSEGPNRGWLTLDRQGRLWVPTSRGLRYRAEGRWETLGHAEGLPSESASCVLEDREGSIWIGFLGIGLARWLGVTQWASWTKAEGLGNEHVRVIRRDVSGALWIGTDHGLYRLTPGRRDWRLWTEKQGLGGDSVRALALGPAGVVWVGTYEGGLSRLDTSTGRILRYGTGSGFTGRHIRGLFIEPEERLWVATSDGLFQSNNVGPSPRFEKVPLPESDKKERVFQVLVDRRGRYWPASAGWPGWRTAVGAG